MSADGTLQSEDKNEEVLKYVAEKIVNLRIFEDENNKLNKSLIDEEGELLVVSNFTLYGNCLKGTRPSFIKAAKAEEAKEIFDKFVEILRVKNVKKVATGEFGAEMNIDIKAEGPVTLILEK